MGRGSIALGLLLLVVIVLIVNLRAVSECTLPLVSVPTIAAFKTIYRVNLQECKRKSIWDYQCLNDFFTRELSPDARSLEDGIVSPVDGRIEQRGVIEEGLLVQAKGKLFSVDELVGIEAGEAFDGGLYATLYLAPHNYHHVHMPMSGRLLATHRITGRSLPVNMLAVDNVNGLYTQNERVVMLFDGGLGLFIMVLVGALFVDSIDYVTEQRVYAKGEDVGKFNFGSTVILLLSPELTEGLRTSDKKIVCMGEAITAV
jgi:phosphatidylserine decarboxylase